MKKIKLLTPMIGLTALTGVAIPLSSCSCTTNKVIPTSDLEITGDILKGIKSDADLSKYDTLQIPSNVNTIASSAFANKFGSDSTIKTIIFSKNIRFIESNAFEGCSAITQLDFSSLTENDIQYLSFASDSLNGVALKGEVKLNANLSESAKKEIKSVLMNAGVPTPWFVEETTGNITCKDKEISSKKKTVSFALQLTTALPSGAELVCSTSVTSATEGAKITSTSVTVNDKTVTLDVTFDGVSKDNDNVCFDISFICYKDSTHKNIQWIETLKSFKYSHIAAAKITDMYATAPKTTYQASETINLSNFTVYVKYDGEQTFVKYDGTAKWQLAGDSYTFTNEDVTVGKKTFTISIDDYETPYSVEITVDPAASLDSLRFILIKDENDKGIGYEVNINSPKHNDIVIPAFYNDLPVTKIQSFYSDTITSVFIPSTVESIAESAFENCTTLTTVKFAKNSKCKRLESRAFAGTSSLENINLPDSILSIDGADYLGSFSNSKIIKDSSLLTKENGFTYAKLNDNKYYMIVGIDDAASVTTINTNCKWIYRMKGDLSAIDLNIPGNVIGIADSAMEGLTLKTLTLNDGLKSIGVKIFSSAQTPISSQPDGKLHLPKTVEYIRGNPFNGWIKTKFDVDANNPYFISDDDGSLFGIDENKNKISILSLSSNATTSETYNMPETIQYIGDYAFDLKRFKKITFNSQLKEIGSYILYTTSGSGNSLTEIDLSSTKITHINMYAFDCCRSIASLSLPSTLKTIDEYAFNYVGYKTSELKTNSFTIPGSVNKIERCAFNSIGYGKVKFEKPTGWYYLDNGVEKSIPDLTDETEAMTYLTSTYKYKTWYRKD